MLLEEMMLCMSTMNHRLKVKKRCVKLTSRSQLFADAFQEEEFYSPGTLELLEARRRIAEFSLPRLDLRYC